MSHLSAVPDPIARPSTPGKRPARPTSGGHEAPDPHEDRSEAAAFDRLANLFVTVAPVGLVGFTAWRVRGGALRWTDLVVLAVTYILTGFGITVGYHRLFTHHSFKTSQPVRALLAVLGSAAVEGPVIEWTANHRKHHQFSDRPGDPHSPHVDRAPGLRGALAALFHAHVGWIFSNEPMASEERYAKDLLADPLLRKIDRAFLLCVLAGLLFCCGAAPCASSCCTTRPSRLTRSATRSETESLTPVTSPATSHGLRRSRSARRGTTIITPSQLLHDTTWSPSGRSQRIAVGLLARFHLAWDVVRISPESQLKRRAVQDRLLGSHELGARP
jgi:hypothetical protein